MSLNTLPTELVEHIARDLDLETFRSFRLVCQKLLQQSLHHFKERFFRRRVIGWDKQDFDKLADITSHPGLGRILQGLVVDATPHHSIRLWELRKNLSDSQVGRAMESEENGKYELEKVQAEEAARFWTETRYDQKVLISVFSKIRKLENVTFSYEGMDRKYGKFGRKYCESSQNEMSRPFVSTMAAIAASGLVVRSISDDSIQCFGAVSIGRLESLSPVLMKIGVALEQLRILKLNLRDWRYPNEGFELDDGRVPFVVRLLAKAKNVRTLELSCFSSLDGDLFGEMAKHCHFSHLEECTLSLFRITSADDLFSFMSPCSTTLRSLCLSHIGLRDDSTGWADLMRRIASDPTLKLERIELKNVFTRLGARIGFEGSLLGWLKLTEPGLKVSLETAAENVVSGNWGPAWHLAAVAYPFVGLRT